MAAINIVRGSRRISSNRRGILGIESAIVMIAFVVVAAALAFVVLNAGFGTTQKSKTTISEGLQSATGAVEVAGLVTGQNRVVPETPEKLEFYSIPIKLASGANAVNLQKELTAVRYFSNSVSYDNIYVGTARNGSNASYSDELSMLRHVETDCEYNPNPDESTDVIYDGSNFNAPSKTCAIIWWSNSVVNNDILDAGEVAVLTIVYKADDKPAQLDKITTELVLAGASVLTVERVVPTITTTIVNMG